MHRWRPPSSSAGSGQNRPLGVCTSISSPGRTSCTSQREKSPSGISRTPTRGARAGRGADGVLAPLLDAVHDPAQGERLAGHEDELVGQVVGHVEGDRDRVVGELLDARDRERVEGGRAAIRSPYVLEGLEAVRAAVERLAGGRAVLRGQLGACRPALRALAPPGPWASGSAGPGRARLGAGPGAERPWSRSACAAPLGDPVAGPRRAQGDLDARGVAGVGEPVDQVVAHRGHRRAAGVGRGDRHDHGRRPSSRTSRSTPRSSRVSIGISGSVTEAAIARARAHHSPCGCARATTCISASIRLRRLGVAAAGHRRRPAGRSTPETAKHLVEDHVDLGVGGPRGVGRAELVVAAARPRPARPAAGAATPRCPGPG